MKTTLLFIPEFLNQDYSSIYNKLYILGFVWVIVLIAMMVDLHYGIKKAKNLNEYITSDGIKRSVQKFKDYYSALLYAFLGDILLSIFTYYLPFPMSIVPLITIIVALLLTYTEFKSVKEKGSQKVWRQMKNSAEELSAFYKMLQEKQLTDKFFDYVKEKENENENNSDNT